MLGSFFDSYSKNMNPGSIEFFYISNALDMVCLAKKRSKTTNLKMTKTSLGQLYHRASNLL